MWLKVGYMHKGWLLVKEKFHHSYETKRLSETFDTHNIDIQIIDPNEIDIFVNKDNKSSILVYGKSAPLPDFIFQEQVVEQHTT